MSSGSSGRYQSRLFNFVHQHSRRLTAQWESTFRHLQVATKWGVEALIYPVYLLWQSANAAVKTLYSQEPAPQPKLQPDYTDFSPDTPPVADTPIQHILEAVKNLPSEAVTVTPTNTSPLSQAWKFLKSKFLPHHTTNSQVSQSLTIPNKTVNSLNAVNQNDLLQLQLPVVRGIATDLWHRQLVLVSIENQILDILTPQQQAKLTDRIISEVANYYHFQQLAATQEQAQLLPEIEQILTKLTGSNTATNPALEPGISQDLPNTNKILAFLDKAVAQLETKAIIPVQQSSQEIIRVAQTQINLFVYGKESLSNTGEIAVNHDNLATRNQNITALIEVALNYFFGVGKDKQLLSQHDKFLPESNQLNNDNSIVDSWLNWQDLYGDSATVTKKLNSTVAPSASLGLSWQRQLNSPPSKAESNLVPSKKQPRKLTRFQPKSRGAISPLRNTHEIVEISQQTHPETQAETQPDWIETKATSVGYEKHILEQVLEWLDHAMLWLEEKLVKIFQRLQSLWRGK
ncbi:hypothetical protein [Anabaena sp. CA = ATCC 33047]|uniref:hypothetical protein n=1 Tax=Anabaena sp. (strain CA / ATCC 33047) TaxID=52271 RepID=UPI000831DCCE|nr:hypothetical protein [Anabaena sp. CA = ATCC 33047]